MGRGGVDFAPCLRTPIRGVPQAGTAPRQVASGPGRGLLSCREEPVVLMGSVGLGWAPLGLCRGSVALIAVQAAGSRRWFDAEKPADV